MKYVFLGLVLIGVATVLGFWLEKKSFERRNEVGVEVFSDYKTLCITRIKEWSVKAIGVGFGLAGLASVVFGVV